MAERKLERPGWSAPYPWGWLAPSVVLILGQLAWGVAVYPRLPDRIPRNYGPGGISGYWDTNLLTVFLPLIVLVGMTVTMALGAAAVLRQTPADQAAPADHPGERAQRGMDTNRPASAASAGRLARALLACNAMVVVALLPVHTLAWDTSGDQQGQGVLFGATLVLVVGALVPLGIAWWRDRQEHRAGH